MEIFLVHLIKTLNQITMTSTSYYSDKIIKIIGMSFAGLAAGLLLFIIGATYLPEIMEMMAIIKGMFN